MTSPTVSFRANPVLLGRIDRLAAARGCTRSAAVKFAVVEASMPSPASKVPDEQELLVLLGEAARGGNVPAMRELRAYHRERARGGHRGADGEGPWSAIDELAARRGP